MPRRYELLVFDWDGTLMDSVAAIAGALQASCKDLGLAIPTDHMARHIIGLGLHDALRIAVPDLPQARYPELVARYREHFLARDAATDLFPGVREALAGLKARGHRLAIATGKSRRGLDRALDQAGIVDLIDASRCADEGHTKPDPGMLRTLLATAGTHPDRAVMIGDTTHDLLMARAASVAGIGVSYGAHERHALVECEPVALCDSVADLFAWLQAQA